jgi:hypothetical protein
MRVRKVEIEQRAEVRAESATEEPVNKSRSEVVEESATFFTHSSVSMVVVALHVSGMAADAFFFKERDWSSKKTKPNTESISSEVSCQDRHGTLVEGL